MASKKTPATRRGAAASAPAADGPDLGSDKLYFRIGEVADIVGVPAYVLRYWESEFKSIRPQKSRTQQRVYRRVDVVTLLRIKHLLYEKKFTIAGARAMLKEPATAEERAKPSGAYLARQSAKRLREMLQELRALVDAEVPPARTAADPSMFVRMAGGARALLGDGEAAQRHEPGEATATRAPAERREGVRARPER
jgi:DNA-binding transcriptional MerR regulator